MSQGICLVCFSATRVLDIKNSGLQNVYEVLSDSQIQADLHPLCYICVTKLLQCQQLLKQINKENSENQSDINPLVRLKLCKTEEWSLPLDFVEIELTPLVTEIEIKKEYIKEKYVEGAAVEFVESPGRESKSPVEDAKSEWKNLKDCFTKHHKGTKSTTGRAPAKYFHRQWAKHMDIMKPHSSFASTITNLEQQSSSDAQSTHSCLSLQRTQARSHGYSQRRRQISSDSKNTFSNTDRIIRYLENKKSNFDATELIFKGYAKSIKQFSIPRQARIKMNIAKMIAEEEVAHYEETMLRFNQPSSNYLLSPVGAANTSRSSISSDHNAQSYIQSQEANTIHNSPFTQSTNDH
ncbi:uncharacterized protein LOC121737832 isoform X6 [Aricia agestis]|uniref:uncharacterized protein LOC121737832 isoform X6 n=1 Tax=Aricia agestis TaxID=91739 RepID=UPI001C202940|nr:uncharacterized protein LOC121737832 isoform X6 [Aricia agestis]